MEEKIKTGKTRRKASEQKETKEKTTKDNGIMLAERLNEVTLGTYNRLSKAIKANWKEKGMKTSGYHRVYDVLETGRIQPANHELPIICREIGCTLEELLNPFFDLALAEKRVKNKREEEAAARLGLRRNAA